MTDPSAGSGSPTSIQNSSLSSLDDRRRRPRRPNQTEHSVRVLDGLLAGQQFDCVVREISPESASLLVKADLRVGQRVQIQQLMDGIPTAGPLSAEVMRARLLTTGRYEVMIEYRRPAAAPKPSESQRRHERRQARLARLNQPVTRSIDSI
jgi:hypothetical protein